MKEVTSSESDSESDETVRSRELNIKARDKGGQKNVRNKSSKKSPSPRRSQSVDDERRRRSPVKNQRSSPGKKRDDHSSPERNGARDKRK